ncbi:MAG: hypothetical protein FK734_14020 [Asgard group archaeon]|nr:hypothetical protein [Asgard group archaeon]
MAFSGIIPNIPGLSDEYSVLLYASIVWAVIVLILVIIWIVTSKKKKGVDVSALAALASSEPVTDDATANADPREVMAILSIERVSASTALSAVKDARKSKRISAKIADSLTNRYKARIAKIDADLKRRSGAQEYQSLAESLEQSRDRLIGEVMPTTPSATTPPPPTSGIPGIPPTAPRVPGSMPPSIPTAGPPVSTAIPPVPTVVPPSSGTPPRTPVSPIPTPPKIPPLGPSTSAKPTTVVPPSVAPPTISTPPLPPSVPTSSSIAPPTTSDMAPPPVPTSVPTTPTTAPSSSDDSQSISGLRMEMLRELARLKKFMSEESQ